MPEECFICYDEITPEKEGFELVMSGCGCHPFVHKKCLLDWWTSQDSSRRNQCPMCRTGGMNFTLEMIQSSVSIPVSSPSGIDTTMSMTVYQELDRRTERLQHLITQIEEELENQRRVQGTQISSPPPRQIRTTHSEYNAFRRYYQSLTPKQRLHMNFCIIGIVIIIMFLIAIPFLPND